MSQATKRKHVVQEVLGEHMVPSDQQQIVKVRAWVSAFLYAHRTPGMWEGLSAGQCVLDLTGDVPNS